MQATPEEPHWEAAAAADSGTFEDDDEDACRVCRLGGSDAEPLFHPCLCKGSIKFVHQSCLIDWLEHRPGRRQANCELCSHPLSFTPIYAEDAPDALTCKEVISGVASSTASWLPHALRFALVMACWLILVPLLTAIMFRGCIASVFSSSPSPPPSGLSSVLPSALDPYTLWRDSQYGVVICLVIIIASIVLASFRDLLVPEADADDAAVVEQADRHGADQHEVDAVLENVDELPVAQWVGVDGPWRFFAIHIATVLFYNFLFLTMALGLPMRIGRITLTSLGIGASDISWGWLRGFRTLLEALLLDVELASSWLSDDNMKAFHDGATLDYVLTAGLGYLLLLSAALLWLVISAVSKTLPCVQPLRSFLRQVYLSFKVSTLIGIELLLCPVLFGVAIDIMTLDLRQVTWASRRLSILGHPISNVFLYWVVGLILIIQVSVFAMVLRKTLRRDVYLRFLRDPEDPDFHPIQELIDEPFILHVRKLVLSFAIYLVLTALCLHIPSKMAMRLVPSLAPLRLRFNGIADVTTDLLVFHICLPFALERILTGRWHIRFVQAWFRCTCKFLSLTKQLLPEEAPVGAFPPHDVPAAPPIPVNAELFAADAGQHVDQAAQPAPQAEDASTPALPLTHTGMVAKSAEESSGQHMLLRVFLLLLLGWITHIVAMALCVLLPLLAGRHLLSRASSTLTHHDFHAYLVGINVFLGIGWVIHRIGRFVLRRDFARAYAVVHKYVTVTLKLFAIALLGGMFLPLLVGLVFELTMVIPMLVPLNESPSISIWQDWAIGLVVLKAWSRIEQAGLFGDTQFKRVLDQIERNGFSGLQVRWTLSHGVWPLLFKFSALLSLPYAFARGVYPLFVSDSLRQSAVLRYAFLAFVSARLGMWLVLLFVRSYTQLEAKMFEDKYLVGRRLRNYS